MSIPTTSKSTELWAKDAERKYYEMTGTAAIPGSYKIVWTDTTAAPTAHVSVGTSEWYKYEYDRVPESDITSVVDRLRDKHNLTRGEFIKLLHLLDKALEQNKNNG